MSEEIREPEVKETELPETQEPEKKAEEAPKLDKHGRPIKKKTLGREIFEWVMTIVAALAIAFVIRTFGFELVRVDGASMNDTLQDTEIMFVSKLDYSTTWLYLPWENDTAEEKAFRLQVGGDPARFDAIICHYPGRGGTNFVKRVIGLPGDVLSLENGYLTVNGVKYEENYVNDDYRKSYYTDIGPYTVPKKGDVLAVKDGVVTLNGTPVDETMIYGCVGTNSANTAASTSYVGQVLAGGNRVAIVRGVLFVNTQRVTEDASYTVDEDYYFVMGDHRNNSNDSRAQGPISRSMVVGHVRNVIWPLSSWRAVPNGLEVSK